MAFIGTRKRAPEILGKQLMQFGDTHCTTAMLEVADRCNETCVHCYQEQGNKGEIDTAHWKKIIDDLAELGVLMLIFSGGEATLRPDLLELMAHARERAFAVKLYTNGLGIDGEFAARLAALAVLEAQISLYSHRPEVHDWITGVPGSHARTLAGIRCLREHGVRVLVKSPVFSVNADEIEDWIAQADALDVDYTVDSHVKARETGVRDPQGLAPTRAQLGRVLRLLRGKRDNPPPPTADLGKSPCGACRQVNVEANGEVRPCAALPVPLGNALEEGVVQSYRESSEAKFVRSTTYADMLGCRECDLMGSCARCYADARFEGGDALAPYASACGRAILNRELHLGHPIKIEGAAGEPPIGPFRWVSEDTLEAFEAHATESDLRIREEQPWIRYKSAAAAPRPTETGLVQIRRPGRNKPIGGTLPRPACKG